jgi:predicted ATPase
MKEKLIIKNFGPIKSVELDLGRFNILIGEQATGKSTVAKVLAVCRYFSYVYGENNNVPSDNFELGLNAWGLKESIQSNSYIFYESGHYIFIAQRIVRKDIIFVPVDGSGNFEYIGFSTKIEAKSPAFKNLLVELGKIKPKENNESIDFSSFSWRIPTSFFLNDVKNVLDNPFYLPTQRGLQSIFSLGRSSIPNISDSLFNQLAKMDGIAHHFTKETYIDPLDVFYKNVQGYGYIRKASETEYYSLFNAASGYQSEIPIVLVIKYYTEMKKRKKTFIIEEPELNLFPSAQNKLMQYLVDKTINYGNSVLLTTQSPYILTSLNNMMYVYQVGQINPERVSEKIDKKYWINPADVSAYLLKSDGMCENIIDDEGLIRAEKIDEVSKVINKQFNEILDIEISENEEA